MNKTFLAFMLLAAFLFPQQQHEIPWPTLAKSAWPMVSHDPQITGRSPYAGPRTLTIRWSKDMPYCVYSGPILSPGGNLFVGTSANRSIASDTTNFFYALTPDGQQLWRYSTGDPFQNAWGYLMNNEGTIIFGAGSGWLYALDTNGVLKWKYNTGGAIASKVMTIDLQGNIYLANSTKNIFSISKNGTLNWKKPFNIQVWQNSVSIAPNGRTLYVSGVEDSIFALNLDGSVKWTFNRPSTRAPLLIDNGGNIYFLAYLNQPKVICLDSSGQMKWSRVINNGQAWNYDSGPAMDASGNLYYFYNADVAGSRYARIESVDYTGNFRWTCQLEQRGEMIEMPLICDKNGTVYCGSTMGYNYYAVSSSGQLLWSYPLDGYYVENSGAIGSDGTLYFGKNKKDFSFGVKSLVAIKDTGSVDVETENLPPEEFILNQNYPNPFNPATTITYALPVDGIAVLKIYDILGNEIRTVVNEEKTAGRYTVSFNASALPSGTYFYELRAGEYREIKKMVVLK